MEKNRDRALRMKSQTKKQLRLAPAYIILVLWLLFSVASIGWIFLASFSTTREIFSGTLLQSGWHFGNYVTLWQQNNVALYFGNSVLYTVTSCALLILIAAPAAYIFGRKVFRGRGALLSVFVAAMSIPTIMISIPLYSTFSRLGMLNSRATLIAIYVASFVPFTTFFLTSFFISVPGALEDAARIDGCTQNRAFWQIMLPMVQPGIITVTVFNFMNIWNEYFNALIFAGRSEMRPLSVGVQAMIQSMRFTGNWAGLFAAIVIVFLPTFILYLFLSEKVVAGVTGGAVKG